MDSDKKIAARDKLVSMACAWLSSRDAKNGMHGTAKEAGRVVQRNTENALAAATEEYQKEN